MMDLETYFAYKATDFAVGMALFGVILGGSLVVGVLKVVSGILKERQKRRTRKLLEIEDEE